MTTLALDPIALHHKVRAAIDARNPPFRRPEYMADLVTAALIDAMPELLGAIGSGATRPAGGLGEGWS